jgi:hypothetical protein
VQRKREDGAAAPSRRKVDPKEEEEIQKREAARARVAARTKAAFGLT